ncbi:MAG TPA: hypothetical protein VNK24_04770 [Elusimicrobiota bacterium]|nr:hypothetical protein [Elusimicrobiota bacterium]
MNLKNKFVSCAGLLAAGLGLTFIAGCHHYVVSPIAKNAPDWVNKGNGAFKDGGQSVFYGVGSVQGIRNIPLAQMSADDRARGELAKIMNDYVATLTKDYMASTTAGDMTKSSEEQMVSSTMKNFAEFTLHGAVIVDRWVDRSVNPPVYYSLCKLDMNAVQQSLNQSKDLNAQVRDYVKQDANKAFDALNAEEAKHNVAN